MKALTLLPSVLAVAATPLSSRATTVTTSDLTNFDFYAQYSASAYCNSNTTVLSSLITCPTTCPIVVANRATIAATIDDNNPTNIDGLLALDPTRNLLILTIRGSQSIRNWIANLLFATIPCPAGMFASASDCGMHAGFALAWGSISPTMIPAIKQLLAASPGRKLVLTGHSLGGAVSTIAAAYIRGIEKIPCDVYTYGSPRIGNAGFANAYNGLSSSYSGSMGRDYRVTHAGDPVPRLPPLIAGFRHTGVEYWISTEILDRDPMVSEMKVCEGTANTGCNAGSDELSTDAHGAYFGDISGCAPGGGLKWRRDGEEDEVWRRVGMYAELDREYARQLEAAGAEA